MSASTVHLLPRTALDTAPVPPALPPAVEAIVETPAQTAVEKLPLSKSTARDHRLDFWRGLCLIDMLLVHLIHQGMHLGESANLWIGEYTRFAAGGFIFIAGLSISRIYLPRAREPEKRRATYRALWKRAGVILAVHFIAETGFLTMWPMFAGVSFRHILQPVWGVVTLRGGYDLLPFYVVMVALAPPMLELMRRRLWWVLAAGSLGLFYYAHHSGCWATNSLPFQHDFYPILWQVIFVTGVLTGDVLPKYDRLPRWTKGTLFAVFAAAHVVLFLAYYGPNFNVHIHPYVPLEFKKVPLTDGEALRYLTLIGAIMIGTDLIWPKLLAGGKVAGICERLGRNSLAVYVFHVWVVQLMVRASDFVDPGPWRWVMAIVGLAMLWGFAWMIEEFGPKSKKKAGRDKPKAETSAPLPRPIVQRWLRYPVNGMTGLAAATLVALIVVNKEQAHYSKRQILSHRAMQSPVSDLLIPRDDQPLPDFVPDPDDIPDDEEEEPVVPKEPERPAGDAPMPPHAALPPSRELPSLTSSPTNPNPTPVGAQ